METKEKLEKIKQGIAEIITEKELEEVLSKSNPRVYVGYEPSGKIHLGHALSVNKLIQMQSLGFNVVVLLADLHAYLNGKGSLEQIRKIAEYNKQCFIALGLDPEQTEFVFGSEIQLRGDYFLDVQRLALQTTLLRAKRSMDLVGRQEENPKVARVIYPLMQVIDMVALRVDVALGGMDQRKIHMLARDNLPKLGYSSPVCMHLPIIHGLDGDEKMSSSKENFIAIDDAPEVIKKKMKKAELVVAVIIFVLAGSILKLSAGDFHQPNFHQQSYGSQSPNIIAGGSVEIKYENKGNLPEHSSSCQQGQEQDCKVQVNVIAGGDVKIEYKTKSGR